MRPFFDESFGMRDIKKKNHACLKTIKGYICHQVNSAKIHAKSLFNFFYLKNSFSMILSNSKHA
jgi:hypothetical protein